MVMRVRSLFVGFSVSLIAAAAALWACGGTETESTPVDAGVDTGTVVTDSGPKDTGAGQEEAGPTDAGCDLDADFTKNIPDAEIPDSGTTTGICLGCGETKCTSEFAQCNADCSCKGIADKALVCYGKSGGNVSDPAFLACVGPVPTKNLAKPAALLQCLNSKCKTECAADMIDAGQP